MYRIISKRVILFLLLLLVLDIAAAPFLTWGYARPSFSYLAILYVAFEYGWKSALPVAILVGFLRDLTSGAAVGMETLLLAFVVFVLDKANKNVISQSTFFRVIVTFLFILGLQILYLAGFSLVSPDIKISWFNLSLAVKAAFLNTLILPPFLYLATRFFDKKKRFHQFELFR